MPREKKNKIRKDKRYRRVYHGIPFYSRISDDDAKAKRDEYIRNEKRGFVREKSGILCVQLVVQNIDRCTVS